MKVIIYGFVVFLPALIVGISNFSVFPDSWWVATLMLVVTAGVAGVFTYFSGDATPKISRYCILADIAICAILCVNLGGHWILAREVSAARQGVTERHGEEDREEKRRADEAERRLAQTKADADLQDKERRRLRWLPPEQRRSVISAPKADPTKTATIQPLSLVSLGQGIEPKLTPDQVRAKWWWFLTALAIAECAASCLAGAILTAIWEWDRNHDGVADHLQTAHKCIVPNAHAQADAAKQTEWPKELDEGKAPRR